VGDIRDEKGRLGDSRYFATQAPGPAVDVSDDLLKRFADSNGLDFSTARKKYRPLELKKATGGIEAFIGPNESNTLFVTWEQLSNIVQDVKRTGKQHAVENPHTVYLKKDY
jgi:hypothetical protein